MKTQLSAALLTMCKKLPYCDSNGENPYLGVLSKRMGFTIVLQDGPIGESGVNGMQITEALEFIKEIYKELNSAYPCRENSITITKIEEAIHWQDARTKDREARGVEGQNKD